MKKYRTKSGNVEEKLPGINATVSPSEKAQIAMAGGANTLSDVQTILGQQGKRNNLKGQGAKHILSFDSESGEGMGGQDDPDDPSDDPGPSGDETSDEGYGFTGQQGYGPSGDETSDEGFGFTGQQGQSEDDEDEGKNTSIDLIGKAILGAQKATEMTVGEQYARGLINAKNIASLLPGMRHTRSYDPKDKGQVVSSPFSAVGAVIGALSPVPGGASIGSKVGTEIDKSIAAREKGEKLSKELQANPNPLISTTNPFGLLDPAPPPGPDPGPDEGGTEIPKKKKKLFSAASNNANLAIADSDDPTRKDLRRARRQVTRFA
jgi:hypothetical protein